ncbi:RHS repeat domain-containing protein [Pseudomonas kermanshahensis]|uniref:RHS repeat domain-containing protein n=1 Tax=Pseudomonas kermanshahensis TaxID=2745482 RepID=UPI0020938C47|nr:sugar-binding protein [Pseudomonas kermanshahensis]USS57412.1 sugar-binding protein [Pseudomonas kermanshahensis]
MTAESVVHSNAFNFMSFITNSVDPRTGQYTLAIQLPNVPANHLQGPNLPLQLAYNPLNTSDSGFGKGWNINLSQYLPSTRELTLHTGEQFVVTSTETQPARIREQKLDSFRFYRMDASNYRVVHKSGLVEHLRTMVSNGVTLALPYRVYAPSGHWIELAYTRPSGSSHQCLTSIQDATGKRLLQVEYVSTGRYNLHLHPGAGTGGRALATYAVHLTGRLVEKVVLPTKDQGSWRFTYLTNPSTQNMTCLATVATPTGSVETITYDDAGHRLPTGAPRERLPRVKSHVLDPGADQPVIATQYTYSSENFMAGNSTVTWSEGEDNLYKAGASYTFTSTEQLLLQGEIVRKIVRTYDRHHLMTRQVTEQLGETLDYDTADKPQQQWHVTQTDTLYHGNASVGFDLQPPYFQMPKRVTEQWRMRDDPTRMRAEASEYHYDDFGNQTLEVKPNGVRVVSEYYPAAGSGDDCPADPQGFVRNLKKRTVYPSALFESSPAAPVLRTDYRYGRHDSILSSRLRAVRRQVGDYWLQVKQETQLELTGTPELPVEVTLRDTTFNYILNTSDPFRHGRLLTQTMVMHDKPETATLTEFEYESQDNGTVLQTLQTLIGFDEGEPVEGSDELRNSTKQITLRQCVLIDLPLLNRDDNDVEIAYEYDELRRVTKETVSPNDATYRASRQYTYQLVATGGQQAQQTEVDVKGVATLALVDGLKRLVRTERHDADAQDASRADEFRINYTAEYDVFGNLVKEVEHDWLDEADPGNPEGPVIRVTLELPRTRRYDGWNQQYAEIGADGVMHVERTDLIGSVPGTQGLAVDSQRRPPRHARVVKPGEVLADDRYALRTNWSQTPDGKKKGGKTIQWLNTFDQPIEVQRVDTKGTPISRHQYFYDGLGRRVREIDARQATVSSVYDAFDRLVEQTLADGSKVHREYAEHSSEDLPICIAVDGKLLGEQRFDGLDRMIQSITGGRKRVLHYLPGQRQASWVITPRGARIDYTYLPQLGEEPLKRAVPSGTLDFEYDAQNARLMKCLENGHKVLERDYFSTGQVKLETRTVEEGGSVTYTMRYRYSLRGRELTYEDVLGNTQIYKYDDKGRLSSTELGTTKAEFDYDELGRMTSYVTTDGSQRLGTFLGYDDFDRETERRFELQNEVQLLVQAYDAADALTERHLMTGDGKTLRLENYWYDKRGHLEDYESEGELSPVDPYGKTIAAQAFHFDALDNITRVDTWFPNSEGREEKNTANYRFDNPLDPAQLTGITNTHEDYPDIISLPYDEDGNLIQDEQGRTLVYNALGQLERVVLPDGGQAVYGYDPLDRLASQGGSALTEVAEQDPA